MSARLLLFLVFLPVVARIFHIPLESTTEFLAAGREAGTTEVTHARGELSQRTSNPKCQNRRMQTDSALAFGVRELAPAFASTGSFESAGSPREITGAGPGNAIGWSISWGKPAHSKRFAQFACPRLLIPSVETLGYSQMSLRDRDPAHSATPNRAGRPPSPNPRQIT